MADIQLALIDPERVVYSIDTCVFLDIWCPPEVSIFSKQTIPSLWEYIESLVEDGRIIATREVYEELHEHASEDLLAWLKAHRSMFIESDESIILHASSIINGVYSQYKKGYKPEVKDGADPFVVAVALSRQGVVLSQEYRQDPHIPSETKGPRVPTVCDACGVECVNIRDFIAKEGFRIQLIKED